VREERSRTVSRVYDADRAMLVWWGAELECVSAISRLERAGDIVDHESNTALSQLDRLRTGWTEVEPVAALRLHARRLLRVHDLRTGDALQLAAALVGAEIQPPLLPFVTLDRRLADAARLEGFPIVAVA
jgi:hypothetical protein